MNWKHIFFPFIITIILGSIALNYVSKQPYGFFRSSFFADKAGYYVYLPYVFKYGLETSQLPDSVVVKTGLGFNLENEKIYTKYPIGVAYMEAPFFLSAYTIDAVFLNGVNSNPFGDYYKEAMVWAPSFYVAIGLYLLFLSLQLLQVPWGVSLVATGFTLLGTSLFYYTILDGLMSHSFSFSLFSAFSYLWLKLLYGSSQKIIKWLLALVVVFIVLVRPFNAIMIPVFAIALAYISQKPLVFAVEIALKLLAYIVPMAIVFIIPQLLYYKFVRGSWLLYSYGEESFNFLNPELFKVFFHPTQGLLYYVPSFIFLFLILYYQALIKPKHWLFMAISVAGLIYVLSSWHSWSFGCGFGIRAYVDYLPLLILPLAFFLSKSRNALLWSAPLLALLVFVNIRLSYQWSGCWFGKEPTFAEYIKLFWQ